MYGACSTFVQSTLLGSALISGGYLENAVCVVSSHFCTAERQFRFPVEMGNQRPPQASWTTTACGCLLLTSFAQPRQLRVTSGTIGRVIDLEIKDSNHMGAIEGINKYGLLGALTGGVTRTAAGISAAVLFGLLNALIFKPHTKP